MRHVAVVVHIRRCIADLGVSALSAFAALAAPNAPALAGSMLALALALRPRWRAPVRRRARSIGWRGGLVVNRHGVERRVWRVLGRHVWRDTRSGIWRHGQRGIG